MKRLISLVIALTMVFTFFAFSANAEEEIMTIDWLAGHDTSEVLPDDTVRAYLEDMFGVKLNVWYIERDNYDELLTLRISGGEIPDVFWLDSSEMFASYVKQGLCMELPIETIAELMPESYAWLMEFDPNCFDLVSFGGKNYGLPRVNLDGAYTYAPFWRADWLAQIGYENGDVPMTLDEFEEVFYFFGQGDPDGNGIDGDTYALSNKGMFPIYGAFGAMPDRWIEDENGDLVYGAVYPGMKDALELIAKWYADGLVDPEFVTGENQGGYWALSVPFENGIMGYSSSGAYYHLAPDFDGPTDAETGAGNNFKTGRTLRNFDANYGYDKVVIGYNPVGPDGKSGGENWGLTTSEAICLSYKLADQPEKVEKILEIINAIGSDYDLYVKIRLWDLNTDVYTYDSLLGYIKPDGYSRADADTHGNMFNTLQNPYFAMKYQPAQYEWANSMPQFAGNGYNQSLLAITTASMPDVWTACETYRQGAYVEFIRGEKSLDEWDSFVEQWYAMGGEAVTEEANEWYHSR